MYTTTVVFVHGFLSDPKVFEDLTRRLAECDFGQPVASVTHRYDSPLFRKRPTRSIPDADILAGGLWTALQPLLRASSRVYLVGHSQGGVVIQRMLAERLGHQGGAQQLASVIGVTLFACPNTGSGFALGARRILMRSNPQEKGLRPHDEASAKAHAKVVQSIDGASSLTDWTCPIPITAYAAESDGVVARASAHASFRNYGVLPGDHASILAAPDAESATWVALRMNLEDALNASASDGFATSAAAESASSPARPKHTLATRPVLPPELTASVADRSALLFVGAGMSLAAGLPSASAFAKRFLERIRDLDPNYTHYAHGGDFNSLATDLESLAGSAGLRAAVVDMMSLEADASPDAAYRSAVALFDLIVTTNYDTLIARADVTRKLAVISTGRDGRLPDAAVVMLHGVLTDPASLVLTHQDLADHGRRRAGIIDATVAEMSRRPVVVVGSSLRDPTTAALFDRREAKHGGWVVGPDFGTTQIMRLRRWHLEPVPATAISFFEALQADLRSSGQSFGSRL